MQYEKAIIRMYPCGDKKGIIADYVNKIPPFIYKILRLN